LSAAVAWRLHRSFGKEPSEWVEAALEARPDAGPALVRLFREPRLNVETRWAVGAALNRVADASLLDEMIALTKDRSLGPARQLVWKPWAGSEKGHAGRRSSTS